MALSRNWKQLLGILEVYTMIEFSDSQFVSAREKRNIIRDWERFVKNGLKFHHFTKALYLHLTLRCMFIAHFDRGGFYSTYFADPEDTIRFLHQFDIDFGFRSVEYGMTLWVEDSDCRDVNRAMCEIVVPLKASLYEQLSKESTKKDLEKARLLLEKHGLQLPAVPEQVQLQHK